MHNPIVRNEPGCGVVKIVAVYPIGRDVETKKSLAQATASMIKKSTQRLSNAKLQSTLDYYAVNIDVYASSLYITAEMYCIDRYASYVIPLFVEILYQSTFAPKDWKIVQQQSIEFILQSENQSDYWADKMLYESIWGQDHVLGYYSSAADYQAISVEDIRSFYEAHFLTQEPKFFLSGDVSSQAVALLSSEVANYSTTLKPHIRKHYTPIYPPIRKNYELDESSQASIRAAICIPRYSIEDFMMLEWMSFYLGGYYTSELMNLLRIEKGFTYGAHAYCQHLPDYTMLIISYDTDSIHIEESLHAIKELLDRLKLNGTIDMAEAKSLYYSQWAKNSERSLQEIVYDIKMNKLGYEYSQYQDIILQYQQDTIVEVSPMIASLLDFSLYFKSVAF